MANPTQTNNDPVVIEATTNQSVIAIDPRQFHELEHFSEDNAGDADSETIYLAFRRTDAASVVTATPAEGSNKWKLRDGKRFILRPGYDQIAFKTAAGSPTFGIAPLGRDLEA